MVTDQLQNDLNTLKADFRDMQADLRKVLAGLRSESTGRLGDLRQRIREQASHRVEQLKDGMAHARVYGHRAADRMERQVKERPLVSILAALGIGALLGRLLTRRRHE